MRARIRRFARDFALAMSYYGVIYGHMPPAWRPDQLPPGVPEPERDVLDEPPPGHPERMVRGDRHWHRGWIR